MMTTDDGLNISNKVAKEINTTTSSSNVDFGVKLHQPIDHHQSFPSSTPMMVPHVNHHRPMFDNGPTSSCDRNKSLMNYISDRIYHVAAGGATSGGAVGVRNLQPFDISETSISTAASAFRSPGCRKISLLSTSSCFSLLVSLSFSLFNFQRLNLYESKSQGLCGLTNTVNSFAKCRRQYGSVFGVCFYKYTVERA